MLGEEPRTCPDCGRLLHNYKGIYFCHNCWNVLEKENTRVAHPELCRFIISEAEAGKYFNCFNCGKSLFFTNEELESIEEEEGRLYNQLEARKEELEALKKEWALSKYLNDLSTEELLELASTRKQPDNIVS